MNGWPRIVFLAMEWLWAMAGLFCFSAALLSVVHRDSAETVDAFLHKLNTRPVWRWCPVIVFGGIVPLVICMCKTAQYFSFLLDWDTGIMGNSAWNFIHGNGWTSSVLANASYFTVHFAFTVALFSPLLWLWEHIMALVLTEAVAVGSVILGVYMLGRLYCRPLWGGWCLAILALSQPLFQGTITACLDNSLFAASFFIWGIYCWESGRYRSAAILFMLLLTTREQVPFLFLGLGFLIFALANNSRRRLLGGGVVAASIFAWLAEMMIVEHARNGRTEMHQFYWGLYKTLGGSPEQIRDTIIYQPWKFLLALFYPYAKIWVALLNFLSLSLLPLAAGVYLLPALVVWLPQQLSDRLYRLEGHYASMVLGPLLWAAAIGLRRILGRTHPSAHRFVMMGILTASACCFFASSRFLPNSDDLILISWRRSAPAVLEGIPPYAKLWCDDMLTANLSMRRYIKALPHGSIREYFFANGLFVPDRVILSRRWMGLTQHATRDAILLFLENRKFRRVFQDDSFIVFANPATSGQGFEPVEWATLP
mgnify:FL=1